MKILQKKLDKRVLVLYANHEVSYDKRDGYGEKSLPRVFCP